MVSGVSGGSLYSASGIETLIRQTMALERQPVTRLETQKDELQVKKGIYSDIKSKLEALRTSIQDMTGDSGSLNAYKATVNDKDILTASVNSNTSLVNTQYSVTVNNLAVANRYASVQHAHSNEALNITGTLTIGGADTRSVSNISSQPNTVNNFLANTGVNAIREDYTELGSGKYYVESRHYNDTTWQFRLVDEDGNAVSVDDADEAGTAMTSGWQDLSAVSGQTFDTGRGLQIAFGGGPYTEGLMGGDAASVDYQAQGATITVDANDTLIDIRDAINGASFADGDGVTASVIDNKLVLSSIKSGTKSAIQLNDDTTGGTTGLGLQLGQIVPAEDASVTINGVIVTRQSNTGLKDIVSGLTLNLVEEGTTLINVAKDNSDVAEKIKTLLTNFNDLTSHLKLKTEAQIDSTATGDNPTYTPAPLGRDSTMRSLRFDLSSDILSFYGGAATGKPNDISDLGITFDSETLTFTLSDQSKLTSALDDDFEATADMLDHILGKMESRIDKYVEGTNPFIDTATKTIEDQIEMIDNRVDSYESVFSRRETALRKQYYQLQTQLLNMQYSYQQVAAMYGNTNVSG